MHLKALHVEEKGWEQQMEAFVETLFLQEIKFTQKKLGKRRIF